MSNTNNPDTSDQCRQFASREELIAEARRSGMAIHCSYQDLWWTPDELEKQNAAGSFRWGVQNFHLLPPAVGLEALMRDLNIKLAEVAAFKNRFGLQDAFWADAFWAMEGKRETEK